MVGPYEVLSRLPGWKIDLVAADMLPVTSDRGMAIVPTVTREDAPRSDLLVIPGGAGADIAMLDHELVDFVRTHAGTAKFVLGICTGALLLGAPGLLTGRRAGAHWQARDLLAQFGPVPCSDRVVIDGTYYTSAGVTSGIDAALRLVADLEGERRARMIQLAMEYDPAPPFRGGTATTSPAEIVAAVTSASRATRAA
ncbi:MAG: DJ-1/PfpI family protein [Paracoccus sp. (in: a-proteobacteria)]|uniref:DJ-1/PfpI family protein n=1 Tax=Paracoccus sp. TaxID=267 RepID=UPI004059C4CF